MNVLKSRLEKHYIPAVNEDGFFVKIAYFVLTTSILFMHLGSAFGVSVPVVTAAALMMILVLGRARLGEGRRFLWFCIFPLVALASTAWSEYASITLYYSVQLLLTVLAAGAIWIVLDLRGFIRALFVAAVLICLVSIADGRMGPSKTGMVLVGVTGSKNAMATVGNLVAMTGMALLLDRWQPWLFRLAAAPAIALGLYLVATTNAATVIILTLVTPAIFLALAGIHLLPRSARLPVVVAVAMLAAPLVILGPQLAESTEDYVLTTFNKDRGLTGRAYLWEVANEQIAQRPLQGYGFKSFWMSNSAATVGALRSQSISDPRTFGLHQTYLEVWLDTGLIGLVPIVLTFVVAFACGLGRAVYQWSVANAFCAIYLFDLVVRSFGETIIAPFYAYCTILFALSAYTIFGDAADPRPGARKVLSARGSKAAPRAEMPCGAAPSPE